ncbi:MAG: hypothetical protein ABFS18_11400 [Thermodesulfobacteriota bacterium]
MKLILQTLEKTFANRFKRYSFLICLILLSIFLITNDIDNGFQEVATETGIEENTPADATEAPLEPDFPPPSTIVDIPFIGEIDAKDFSLPVLAIILGLVDGLNPCAMWVLVYLISLVATLKDRRKTWLIVGSFVFTSGVLYFLFMTAWLNAYLFMGYVRQLTLLVGFFALWAGMVSIYESIKNRGQPTCEIGNNESKNKTMARIKKVALSPLSIGSFFAIIALAFVVNSIEFLCSAAIPAVFTHILSISPLNTMQYYMYILLYDFFFMFDDLLIFATAAFAVTSTLGEKYTIYTKPIGGVIMLIIGIILIFFPSILR